MTTDDCPTMERSTAWGCLLLNLALPGVGTFTARRRVTGVCQFVLSQTGFIGSMVWAGWFILTGLRTGHFPCEKINNYFLIGFGGALLFIVVWIWALVTSLVILSQARNAPPVILKSQTPITKK